MARLTKFEKESKRILTREYEKYIIDCLKTGEKAVQFEEWFKKLREEKK